MAHIITGQNFSAGDQVTSGKLNNIIGDAKLDSDSITGTTLNLTNGELKVATNGITDNELNANSVTTAKIANDAVTYDKIQDVAASSVIGNTTGSTATPTNVSILDEDTMVSNSATALATQQSIKAYVDAQVGSPVSKYTSSEQTLTASSTITVSHGLGSVPDLATGHLVCKTADAGYLVGDLIEVLSIDTQSLADKGVLLRKSSTQVIASIGQGIEVPNNSNLNNTSSLTLSSWRLVLTALTFS